MKELLGQIAIGIMMLAMIIMGFPYLSPKLTKKVGERVVVWICYLGWILIAIALILIVISVVTL